MLLIPRSEGLRTRKIEIGGGSIGATTYVTFEDVKVPAEYLIGEENNGFRSIMTNFNHERLWIAFQGIRGCRTAIEDAMAWAQKREVFGKTLIEQPVVRYKFGNMAIMVEGLQAWTEQIIYELEHLSDKEGEFRNLCTDFRTLTACIAARRLGGVTALLKVQGGIIGQYISNECVKIMG